MWAKAKDDSASDDGDGVGLRSVISMAEWAQMGQAFV